MNWNRIGFRLGRRWKLVGIAAMAVVAYMVFFPAKPKHEVIDLTDGRPAPGLTMPEHDYARTACKEFVRETLHDAASASFEPTSGYSWKKSKDGTYLVQVTLRARNGFNAVRHIVVDCRTKQERLIWLPLSLKEH